MIINTKRLVKFIELNMRRINNINNDLEEICHNGYVNSHSVNNKTYKSLQYSILNRLNAIKQEVKRVTGDKERDISNFKCLSEIVTMEDTIHEMLETLESINNEYSRYIKIWTEEQDRKEIDNV